METAYALKNNKFFRKNKNNCYTKENQLLLLDFFAGNLKLENILY